MANELFVNKTHNPTYITRICHNKRPCYRVLECKVCWNKQRKHIVQQVIEKCLHWEYCCFCTLTIVNNKDAPVFALHELAKIRKKLHRAIFKHRRYLSLIAIATTETRSTPHFHILVDKEFSQKELRNIFARCAQLSSSVDVNTKNVLLTVADLRRLAGYLMDQNYKTTLPFRPSRLRLMTASRGFYTGRPKPKKVMVDYERL